MDKPPMEIVRKLREFGKTDPAHDVWAAMDLMQEAAALIERQAAVIERMEKALEQMLKCDGGEGSEYYHSGEYLQARKDCFAAVAFAKEKKDG